jgi:4a-hydroxytetrahydrobiopterin dehydratase
MNQPLDADDMATGIRSLPGWKLEGDALAKTFEFASFREALSFMVRVGLEAEVLNHHPDWSNVYNKVAIRLSTHDAGHKVTPKDLELARVIQKISWVG